MMQVPKQWLACLLAVLACVANMAIAAEAVLVEASKARAALVLPVEPDQAERDAAEELATTIEQISGAALPILTVGEDLGGRVPILIGGAAPEAVFAALRKASDSPSAIAVWAQPQQVIVAGATPEATYYAACELLEQLGVRWFMPGDFGTVIPSSPNVALPVQQTIESPSFEARHAPVRYKQAWSRRMRSGGPYFPGGHGVPGLNRKLDAMLAEHPDYFALVNGQRSRRQVCVSNPEVIRIVVEATNAYFRKNPDRPWIGMGPNDGGGFCECENCTALDAGDYDPFSGERSVTDRYIWFFNQVLAGLDEEFKDKKLGFYAYHTYMRPPLRVKPDPRIVPALAPIALCRVHGPDNPLCPEKSYYTWLVRSWSELLPEIYDRGYWFNLADPGFVFSMVHVVRSQIPLGHELGIKGWRVEVIGRFAAENASLYIAHKLMWDHTADVDALMRDFSEKYYGPAAAPMLAYHILVDEALRDSDHHTGSAHDAPLHYPSSLRTEARAHLEQAVTLVPADGDYAKRVEATRLSFEQLEAFITMLEARDRLDFVRAGAALQRVDACAEALLALDENLLVERPYTSYMRRFFRLPVEQGLARVTDGNTLVAACSDTWEFQLDPSHVGEALGYYRPDHIGGNWQQIRSSTSWSNQGLRYYRGVAWYRQKVNVSPEQAGKRVFLWVGGADEKAKVWVNGKALGIVESKFYPFEVDATDAVVAGENNIVIAVVNEQVNELGTGGLTGPVMLYAPAAGAEAKLENTRPAGETFP